MTSIRKALTIAGSDSGGGAGIQADLKTFQELGVYGMSALTALTAQNTLGVQGVFPIEPETVAAQLDSIGSDLPPDAVKTGMLFSGDIIRVVAGKVQQYGWQQKLVIDPVMVAKGGSQLLLQEAVQALITSLLPLSLAITPNLPEAEMLTGMKIQGREDREQAARLLHQMGPEYIILKGGHDPQEMRQWICSMTDGNSSICPARGLRRSILTGLAAPSRLRLRQVLRWAIPCLKPSLPPKPSFKRRLRIV